jgi:hypothetical protein
MLKAKIDMETGLVDLTAWALHLWIYYKIVKHVRIYQYNKFETHVEP